MPQEHQDQEQGGLHGGECRPPEQLHQVHYQEGELHHQRALHEIPQHLPQDPIPGH